MLVMIDIFGIETVRKTWSCEDLFAVERETYL